MALPAPTRNTSGEHKDFPKHPKGLHPFVLVDVIYLGYRAGEWKGKPKASEKVALVVQSKKLREDGKRFELSTELTYSDFENANLVKLLSPWLGPFTNDAERTAAVTGLDGMVGQCGLMTVQREPGKKDPTKTYANIVGFAPLMEGMEPFAAQDYTRAEFWAKKIAEYADGYAKFLAAQSSKVDAVKSTPQGLDEFPAALDDGTDDSDLPY